MEVGCADPYELFSSVYDSFKADDNYSELYSILKGIRAQCSFPLTCPLAWDVGTGTGLFAELLAKDGYVTTATDICPTMIEQAKMRCSSVRYSVADAREEHPAESYFDLVTAIDDVFNCIDSLSGLRATFKNIHLALKGGGLFQFDLVCKKAFLEYMGSVQFRGNESVKFLSYPSSPARDEEHQFSMGVSRSEEAPVRIHGIRPWWSSKSITTNLRRYIESFNMWGLSSFALMLLGTRD